VFNRLQRFWTSIKVAIDVAVLALAFELAYLTRFDLLGGWPLPPPRETLVTLLLVLVLFPVAYRQSRLYATNRVRTHLEEVFELFKATITASLVLVADHSRERSRGSPWPLRRLLVRLVAAAGWASGCGWSRCGGEA
jgi:hypothetical protein